MTIYIVYGSTGEYSDHLEWWVSAFTNEARTADLVQRLTAASKNLEYGDWKQIEIHKQIMAKAGDPNFRMYYTGTRYGIGEVELDE